MKFKKFIFVALILTVLVLTVSGFGFAFSGNGGRGMMNHFNAYGYYDGTQQNYNPLDLDDQQRETLRVEREEYMDKRIELQVELREINFELRELLILGGTDEEIANLKIEINILQTDLLNVRTDYWQDIQEFLTVDQIEKVKGLFEEQESNDSYTREPAMGGFRRHGMAGRGFNPSARNQSFSNNSLCPFAF